MEQQIYRKGKIIAAMGLSGVGKSSVMKELALLCNALVYNEPEEDQWPLAVKERRYSGNFTMLNWFRSMRVPGLYLAEAVCKEQERVALVDSYYDKLMFLYIRDPQMSWLLSPEDPYYDLMLEITRLDHQMLPLANCVVFFETEEDIWFKFLDNRNRHLDENEDFRKSHHFQSVLKNITIDFCKKNGVDFLIFKQEYSSPREAAIQLHKQLKDKGLLCRQPP